jgi:hypothetical protein
MVSHLLAINPCSPEIAILRVHALALSPVIVHR